MSKAITKKLRTRVKITHVKRTGVIQVLVTSEGEAHFNSPILKATNQVDDILNYIRRKAAPQRASIFYNQES